MPSQPAPKVPERRPEPADLARFPPKAERVDLLAVAGRALGFWPPLWVQSILGSARSWLPPHRELSELTILDPRRAWRTLRYLTAIGIPSVPREPPAPIGLLVPSLLTDLFWRPTTLFEPPDPYVAQGAFPGERWFFINGIATNEALARLNAALLCRLFRRPLTVIQNATNSVGLDLIECVIGKEFKSDPVPGDRGTFTEPALEATIAVLDALSDDEVDKVVVIAHSQGTIIAANVLRAIVKGLAKLDEEEQEREHGPRQVADELTEKVPRRSRRLRLELGRSLGLFLEPRERARRRVEKLELYTFANCADRMRYVLTRSGRPCPWIEHFANERDLVARLGILSPCRREDGAIEIDGPVYVNRGSGRMRRGAWGHLLNEHYLFAIQDHLRSSGESTNPYPPLDPGDPPSPRLYAYFRGGSPDHSPR